MSLDTRTRCESCGYELMGSSAVGRCPECGQHYDTRSGRGLVRKSAGLESSERGDRAVMWVKVAALALAAAACLGLGVWRASVAKDPTGPIIVSLMFAGVLGFGSFTIWYTEGRSR